MYMQLDQSFVLNRFVELVSLSPFFPPPKVDHHYSCKYYYHYDFPLLPDFYFFTLFVVRFHMWCLVMVSPQNKKGYSVHVYHPLCMAQDTDSLLEEISKLFHFSPGNVFGSLVEVA